MEGREEEQEEEENDHFNEKGKREKLLSLKQSQREDYFASLAVLTCENQRVIQRCLATPLYHKERSIFPNNNNNNIYLSISLHVQGARDIYLSIHLPVLLSLFLSSACLSLRLLYDLFLLYDLPRVGSHPAMCLLVSIFSVSVHPGISTENFVAFFLILQLASVFFRLTRLTRTEASRNFVFIALLVSNLRNDKKEEKRKKDRQT